MVGTVDEGEEIARAIMSKAGGYYGRRPFALHKAALYLVAGRLGVGIRDVGAVRSTAKLDGVDNPGIVVILSASKGADFVARTRAAIEVMTLAAAAMMEAADADTRFAQEIDDLVVPGHLLADGREHDLEAFVRDEQNWRTADAG